MARFDEGWVKMYRLPRDHWMEEDGGGIAWAIFMKLISWANYQDAPKSKLKLKRGQLITSSVELAKCFGLGRQRVRTALAQLEQNGQINQLANHHGLIITICNYDKFQTNEKSLTSQLTTSQPPTNHQLTTNQPLSKEVNNKRTKEFKKGEEETADAVTPPFDDLDEFLGIYSKRFFELYKTLPNFFDKDRQNAREIIKELGTTEANRLIEKYFFCWDEWFLTKRHDLKSFMENINVVKHFDATGVWLSRAAARQNSRRQ